MASHSFGTCSIRVSAEDYEAHIIFLIATGTVLKDLSNDFFTCFFDVACARGDLLTYSFDREGCTHCVGCLEDTVGI